MASSSSSSSFTSRLPSEPLPWRPNTRPKLPPGALLDIADDLLWDLFTEWLPLEAVCQLDSALCQKKRRPYFLALLATKVLLFNREEIRVLKHADSHTHSRLGAAALNWVQKRGIHLASLYLPREISLHFESTEQSIRKSVASLALDGRLDKLETISLKECDYIEDADIVAILSKCYNSVKSIDIRCHLTESVVAAHIKRCTKLEAFAANGKVAAADMAEIFQACRKLRKVDLSHFRDRLTNEVVLSVADNCHLLEHLSLQVCDAVSDEATMRVAYSCPMLQCVNLSWTFITDATVVTLCNRCRLLKRLFLGGCRKLTDAAVLAVAERLPGLTHIDLGGIAAITSSAVEALVSKCRELGYIDLSDLPNVSDATLSKIAEHCSNLRELRVSGSQVSPVTAVGLTEIATKCSKLKTVWKRVGGSKSASLKQMFPNIQWESIYME